MGKLRFKTQYGTVPNQILNSKKLSLKAKGLYGYLQAKPEGWEFSAERIVLETADGRDAVRSGLRELEKVGLLQRMRNKDTHGQWDHEYILYPNFPSAGFPSSDKPSINKAISKKKLNTTVPKGTRIKIGKEIHSIK